MEVWLLDAGVSVILFLQGLGDWLIAPMAIFSFLGNEIFYLLALSILYWCLNSQAGFRIGLILMISGGLNYLFKLGLHSPRPYWYDPQVRALSAEATFGVPSGHAQHAVVLWGFMAATIRQRKAWFWAVVLISMVGISRLYLGVHFLHDVMIGWLLGGLILWAYLSLEAPIGAWLNEQNFGKKSLAAFTVSLGLLGIGLLVRMSLGDWSIPDIWLEAAAQAAPDATPLDPLNFSGLISGAGAFFGLAIGAIYLKDRGGFSTQGSLAQRLLRFPIGLAGAGIPAVGLGALLPDAGWSGPVLQYLLYALLGVWAAGLAPLVFIRLGLAQRAGDQLHS